ncbi:MAG: cation:proton antiporter [Candidatus Thermoplasmatota archaeon]
MAPTPSVFLVVAVVIALGYAAGRLTTRTRFPDVAMLLLVGLLVGPVNRVLVEYGSGSAAVAEALDPSTLRDVAPLVSGIALVVILFEAGMSLELRLVRRSLGPALRIALPVFILSVAAVASVGRWVYGMPPLVALALGVALSNVGQTVSSALLRRMNIDPNARAVGLVEMAIYDIISVPILVTIFLFAGGDSSGASAWGEGLRGFVRITSISVLLGAGLGLVWVLALRRLHGHPHSYMLTMAALLSLYAITEILGGAGAVSVLLFGLFIGNRTSLTRLPAAEARLEGEETKVQAFHEEVTFLVRTMFFLFLGASFVVGLHDQWPVSSRLWPLQVLEHRAALFGLGAALVLIALPLARAVVIPLVGRRKHRDLRGLIPVFGHGLGTAVLATFPFVWKEFRDGTAFHAAFAPWQPVFVNLAFLVILVSVLGSGLLVFLGERTNAPPAAPAEAISRPARRPK